MVLCMRLLLLRLELVTVLLLLLLLLLAHHVLLKEQVVATPLLSVSRNIPHPLLPSPLRRHCLVPPAAPHWSIQRRRLKRVYRRNRLPGPALAVLPRQRPLLLPDRRSSRHLDLPRRAPPRFRHLPPQPRLGLAPRPRLGLTLGCLHPHRVHRIHLHHQ